MTMMTMYGSQGPIYDDLSIAIHIGVYLYPAFICSWLFLFECYCVPKMVCQNGRNELYEEQTIKTFRSISHVGALHKLTSIMSP